MAPDEQFRTTDGIRQYDFETIGDEEIDADEPTWAQMIKWIRQQAKPDSAHE